jgi:protein-disulfide isomerase
MSKTFWAIIAVIVVIFGGILFFKGHKANAPSTSSGAAQATHHVTGNGKAGVTLIEYGDYQCPYCGAFYPIVKQAVAKYNNQITFQFRNLPLIEIHKNAMGAARAAEAAGMQGKFWEMHDMIYENQNNWSENSNAAVIFEGYAKQLGLNADQFKKDYASSKVNDTINADVAEFQKTGQEKGTPLFFLDGKKITPSYDETSLEKMIANEIAAKSTAPSPAATPQP